MSAMFYSLKEVAEKLRKTEEEVRELARQGRLREFREGPNSLFKAEDVEALMSDTSIMPSKEPPVPLEQKPQEDEISLTPEPAVTPEPTETPPPPPTETPEPPETPLLSDSLGLIETPPPTDSRELIETPEPTETPTPADSLGLIETPEPDVTPQPTAAPPPDDSLGLIETPKPDVTPEPTAAQLPDDSLGLIETPAPSETPMPDDSLGLIETPEQTGTPELSDTPEPAELSGLGDTPEPAELSDLSKTPVEESDLSAADTAIAGSGIDVLDETGSRAQTTDDTVIEAKDTTSETSLREIEEDVNLDSFGSGSGLLDLSLQADDTSLGGILDEIYAPEAGEGQPPAEAGSAVEVAAEAEQILPAEELAAPELVPMVPAIAQAYAEPEPDTVSKALGYMLILPLLAIVYTAIVAVTGFSNIMPAILEKVQYFIWYITGTAVVVAFVIVGAAFMLSGDKSAKPAKVKKEKPPKAKKAKKPKKPK